MLRLFNKFEKVFCFLVLLTFSFAFCDELKPEDFKVNKNASHFFPGGIYSNYVNKAYSKQLSAMNEPSLLELSKKSHLKIYRFLWLRTFHHPISIRLTIKGDGTGELVAKMTSGAGGYEPGVLETNNVLQITKQKVLDFQKQIEKIAFWEMKSKIELGGLDGARWIIEGVKDGKYHLVDRWTSQTKAIHEAVLMLLHLSKFEINKSEIY